MSLEELNKQIEDEEELDKIAEQDKHKDFDYE